ncbi:MAG: glycosyltransferase, partial [bacterium]|nr:glycosyltransferase [bacterium]
MLLTVFTPTYNRRELLGRVYQSLLAQTDLNFIWLIVDDGSTD